MPELIPQQEFVKVGIDLSVTKNQEIFIQTIRKNIVTFVHGPAGTGKTQCALAEGFRLLLAKKSKTDKVIFIKPAVEAQEKIGFLPGDIQDKLAPYMSPLYIISKKLLKDRFKDIQEQGKIEELPLAFLRGITFENCYVILDEAQNTNVKQMELFLGRIGRGAKVVVVGDTRQSDIKIQNGLEDAIYRLADLSSDGVSVCELTYEDNMRSPVVEKILRAYENNIESLYK